MIITITKTSILIIKIALNLKPNALFKFVLHGWDTTFETRLKEFLKTKEI